MAATTKLRVFESDPLRSSDGKAAAARELPARSVPGDGDAAKSAAVALLKGEGRVMRSINWGPNPQGGNDLIAYVAKKAV